MPTYDYQCRRCGVIREVVHSMLEDGPSACDRCGGDLRRIVHATGIIFRGSGFYKTDSRSSSSASVAGGTRSSDGSTEGGGKPADGGAAGGSAAESSPSQAATPAPPGNKDTQAS